MATQFQNRLVGTIILVALGVIFLPDLLDGQKQRYQEPTAAIPLHPELEPPRATGEYREPEALAEYDARLQPPEAVDTVDEAALPPPASTETVSLEGDKAEPATSPAPNSQPEPQPAAVAEASPPTPPKPAAPTTKILAEVNDNAWVIRLGTFKNASNVSKLIAQLRGAGYPAYSEPAEPIEGQLNRVYVGPDVDKRKLEKQLPQLKKLTSLSGRVYVFNPLTD